MDERRVHIHILYTVGSLLHVDSYLLATQRCVVMLADVSQQMGLLSVNLMTAVYGAHHPIEIKHGLQRWSKQVIYQNVSKISTVHVNV